MANWTAIREPSRILESQDRLKEWLQELWWLGTTNHTDIGIGLEPIFVGVRTELDVWRLFDIYVSLPLIPELMPPPSIFAATGISIRCPVEAEITKYGFCSLQKHLAIFLLVINFLSPLFDKFYWGHPSERIGMSCVRVDVLDSISTRQRCSGLG